MCGLLYVHLVYIKDEGGGCEIQKRCCTSVAVIKDQHQHRVMTKKPWLIMILMRLKVLPLLIKLMSLTSFIFLHLRLQQIWFPTVNTAELCNKHSIKYNNIIKKQAGFIKNVQKPKTKKDIYGPVVLLNCFLFGSRLKLCFQTCLPRLLNPWTVFRKTSVSSRVS